MQSPDRETSGAAPEPSSAQEADTFEREHRRIARTARLHWTHWLVVGLSLLITLGAWQLSARALRERSALRFERYSVQVIDLFEERLDSYVALLQSGVGMMVAGESMTNERWQDYIRALRLPQRYPGVTVMGALYRVRQEEVPAFLAHQRSSMPDYAIRPAATRETFLPLVHVSPKRFAAEILGFDIARESRRAEAVFGAIDSGEPRITAPVNLADKPIPGFIMVLPFQQDRDARTAWHEGEGSVAGAVIGSVRTEHLVAGVLDQGKRLVSLRLSDEGTTLYDERGTDAADVRKPMFSASHIVPLYGRDWRFDIETTAAFERDASSHEPLAILVGGLSIDALLFGLFLALTRANRRALSFAARTGERLRAESVALKASNAELARSNEELETFSYVVSHDLKAPLNNIGHLAEFIEEDLERFASRPDPESGRAIGRDLERIKQRVAHARNLIDGILDYSGLGTHGERIDSVDTRRLVEEIVDTLPPGAADVTLEGDFPLIRTPATRLRQVLANLIGNALKYHHDPANARVLVRAREARTRLHLSVSDDGPGIHPHFHERVFELFGTLGSSEESTGVGLSIVKKTVELMGGTLRLDSEPGKGATFSFDWPLHVDEASEDGAGDAAADENPLGRAA